MGPTGPPGSGGSPSTPFTIPNQVHVGSPYLSRPRIGIPMGDNQTRAIAVYPIYEEINADGTPGTPVGRYWFSVNGSPTDEQGTLQLGANGYAMVLATRAAALLSPPHEQPIVVPVDDPTSPFGPGARLCFSVAYRVESSGGVTVPEPLLRFAQCGPTSPCSFQVTFPYGTCAGNPSGTLCGASSQCPAGVLCQYVRNYLDGARTDAVVYVGDCPVQAADGTYPTVQQNWSERWGELKYPGDLLRVNELVERTQIASGVDTTGYLVVGTSDPVAGWAAHPVPGGSVCVGDTVLWPAGTIGQPYGQVMAIHARPDGGGGIFTPHQCSTFAATLPTFADDYGDYTGANGTVIRKVGWTKAALITQAPAGACNHLFVRVDGKGTHGLSCQ